MNSTIQIYNSLHRRKQVFVPIEPGHVSMYVCGMTVYDYCHLGHARVMVVFDMIARWLRANGLRVTYVRNITDIDDKIINRARENGESIHQLTERFIDFMNEDAAALGVQRPDHEPRATEYISEMQVMISTLLDKGLAYVADSGDVCFAVRKFEGYGKLSGKLLDDLRAGERVKVADGKQDPLDFVLWKSAKEDESSEVRWESPWGVGRPGWHIECSAMSTSLLGPHFDIHGGGEDLQFPHHENEIAQSEGAHESPYANIWMHNGFVNVDKNKMSKSLDNFKTIRDVLDQYDAEVLRLFILRAHYRSPLNYSTAQLDDSRNALTRLYTALQRASGTPEWSLDWNDPDAHDFQSAMNDDFNTPGAMAVLFSLAGRANAGEQHAAAKLKTLGGLIGLLQRDPVTWLQNGNANAQLNTTTIDAMISRRNEAKAIGDFTQSDDIRNTLRKHGIVLEDGSTGTTWRRA